MEPVHMDHTFNPHCLSQIYVDKYGKDFEENFYRYCDSVLSGAETVKCDKKEWLAKFRDLSRIYLPIAFRYCYSMDEDITSAGNGEYKLSYGLPKDEYLKKVADSVGADTKVVEQYFGRDYISNELKKEKANDLIFSSAVVEGDAPAEEKKPARKPRKKAEPKAEEEKPADAE